MSKKARKTKVPPAVAEGLENIVLISNTTCQDSGKILWEGIYDMLEKENPKVIEGHATTNGPAE